MKRSEMLSLIEDILDDGLYYRTQAELVLTRVEQAGMLPPPYEGLMANGKKFDRKTDSGRDTARFLAWEPED